MQSSHEHLMVPAANVTMGDRIGEGRISHFFNASAILPSGSAKEDCIVVTVAPNAPSTLMTEFSREAKMCSQFQHPGISKVLGLVTANDLFWMALFPSARKGLKEHLKTEATNISLAAQIRMIRQASEAIVYLEGHGYVHTDLGARSVYVNADAAKGLTVGVIDVNKAAHARDYSEKHRGQPIRWMAPEVLANSVQEGEEKKTTTWMFGVLAWEVLSFGESMPPNCDPAPLISLSNSCYTEQSLTKICIEQTNRRFSLGRH